MNNLVQLQIRKIIFDNFNDVNVRFNNDQILEFLKKTDGFDQSVTIDNLEDEFTRIEDDGFIRCIAQNFTTKWFKLYDDIEKIYCNKSSSNPDY